MWLMGVSSIPAYGQRLWTLVAPAPEVLYSLQFPTADTGYAISLGDSLIRTTDGGKSWNPVNLPITRSEASFEMHITFCGPLGWLVTTETYTSFRVLQTTDYGFTWSIILVDSSTRMPQGIYFKSPALGYLWGFGVTQDTEAHFISISTDSGRSWQTRPIPTGNGSFSITVDAIGQPNVILGEGIFLVDPSPPNFFYLSTDTGATWTPNSIIYHLPNDMAYIGASTWITDNAFTTDNGKTWDTVPTTAPTFFAKSIAPSTDTLGHGMIDGYAMSKRQDDSTLYFTSDFGRSWDSTRVPFKGMRSGVISEGAWYAVGSDGNLYRSQETTSSVSRTNHPAQFQILTNPATHFLQISMKNIPDEIRIVDFLGRTVARYSTQGGGFSADVSSLPEGLYWVVTRSGASPFVHLAQ
jgi:photosystem II stability/assembly factor-like uncharacterized protein